MISGPRIVLLTGLAFAGFAGLAARSAAAEEGPARVAYHAVDSCPTQAVFMERVRSRIRRGTIAEHGDDATFEVTLSPMTAGNGFLGQLDFVAADGRRAVRTLSSATCDELVSSLALITALAVDDRADQRHDDATPTPAVNETRPTAPESSAPKLVAPPRSAEPEAAPSSLPRRRASWGLAVGLHGGLLTWVTNSAALDWGGYAELGSRKPAWNVRLSASQAQRSERVTAGSARFTTDWLRLEACPVTLALPAHLSVAPCVAFDGGLLQATASANPALAARGTQRSVWAAGVALVRLSWLYRERIVVGLDGELGVPFVRRQFAFESADRTSLSPLLDQPAIGAGLELGVGVRFP